MKTIIVGALGFLVPMLILDFFWLTTMVKSFYGKYIGDLLAPNPNFAPAIVFYVLYCVGALVFVVFPAISGNFSFGKVFLFGALFGLVAYGTYDLTNQATLKTWSTVVTVVDLAWGAFITGTASTIALYFVKIWG
jgi:uncharacterized membrane protein